MFFQIGQWAALSTVHPEKYSRCFLGYFKASVCGYLAQELLAAQLIQTFADIFHDCSLPLYLRPYEVLVTSNRTALIELVPDSLSLHTVKAKAAAFAPSLSELFFALFPRGSPACEVAQRAFAESMAGYSLVCYLLQIKVGCII